MHGMVSVVRDSSSFAPAISCQSFQPSVPVFSSPGRQPCPHDAIVVVMGTLGSGRSVHPQWRTVIVVLRHVGVGVGQMDGWMGQIVV